ncbi:hypothetical protein NECAME_12964 [Necator americanus]|uniref:Uncharacterized protein n=1 Tax=Necator americanus TaxID=51031 RepID=W2SXI3_NECAM|nr:hypothetical protein NECAME_12964 [Necator americanus]ETN74464.1 hypothetical protein NECAME_12964 [Necator americanus]
MSGRRKKSGSRGSIRAASKRSSQGSLRKVATVVSVAVVNVDLDEGKAEDQGKLERSKQQATALAESACEGAKIESEKIGSVTDSTKPVTFTVRRTEKEEPDISEQDKNTTSTNTFEQQQRSALSKLDEALDTPSQPRSQLTSESRLPTLPCTGDSGIQKEDDSSKHSSKRSSRSKRSRSSRSRRSRRTGPRSRRRKRRSKSSSESRKSKRAGARRPSSRSKSSKGRKMSKKEKEEFIELLECPRPKCKRCKELRKKLGIPRAQPDEIDVEVKPGTADQSRRPSSQIKHKAKQPTTESAGVLSSSLRTARSGSTPTSSWTKGGTRVKSSSRPQTPTQLAPSNVPVLSAPKPLQPPPAVTVEKKGFSLTSGGSSPATVTAKLIESPAACPPTRTATTYIPERDYNPDICDCYDCICETKSSKSDDKTSSQTKSPHPPKRVKAEYEWIKKLLKIQQPHGRYHSPNPRNYDYPWRVYHRKSSTSRHSHQSGSGAYRQRSTSGPLGISSPSVSQKESQPSIVSSGTGQTVPLQLREEKSAVSKTRGEQPSTSSASRTTNPQPTEPVNEPGGRKKSNRRNRSYRKSRSRRDRSSDESTESWTEPEDDTSGSSYKTPRSRMRSLSQR